MKSFKSFALYSLVVLGICNMVMIPFYIVARPGIDVERSDLMQTIYDYVIFLQANQIVAIVMAATAVFAAVWSLITMYTEWNKPAVRN